ncbi:hypothetical protein ACFQT0_22490 [Hymenobacter humi]|uniref:Uncharacterized protein n=1 Tax=Hymenobacter humi TaxID=1411620 RepID=A0ABW2UAH9_9BACT
MPIELPAISPGAMRFVLTAEGAAAFDELTRSGRDAQMVLQNRSAWPNTFRSSRFIPAVEYLQAQRVRSLAIEQMDTQAQGPRRVHRPLLQPQPHAHQPHRPACHCHPQRLHGNRPAHHHHFHGPALRRRQAPGPGQSLPGRHRIR